MHEARRRPLGSCSPTTAFFAGRALPPRVLEGPFQPTLVEIHKARCPLLHERELVIRAQTVINSGCHSQGRQPPLSIRQAAITEGVYLEALDLAPAILALEL